MFRNLYSSKILPWSVIISTDKLNPVTILLTNRKQLYHPFGPLLATLATRGADWHSSSVHIVFLWLADWQWAEKSNTLVYITLRAGICCTCGTILTNYRYRGHSTRPHATVDISLHDWQENFVSHLFDGIFLSAFVLKWVKLLTCSLSVAVMIGSHFSLNACLLLTPNIRFYFLHAVDSKLTVTFVAQVGRFLVWIWSEGGSRSCCFWLPNSRTSHRKPMFIHNWERQCITHFIFWPPTLCIVKLLPWRQHANWAIVPSGYLTVFGHVRYLWIISMESLLAIECVHNFLND